MKKKIRKVSFFVPNIEKKIKNASKSSIQKLRMFSNTSLKDNLTTMNVIVNTMSPNGNPFIWSNYGKEDLEESPAKIASEATGFSNLYTGKDEDLWSYINKNISIEKLRRSLKKLKGEELNIVKQDVEFLFEFINNLKELSFYDSKKYIWTNFISQKIIGSYKFKNYILIIVIHFYTSKEEKSILEEFLKQARLKQAYLNILADYIRYMKTHPYLKKKKYWNINKCDEKTFKSLQEHQQRYINNHSGEIQEILNYNTL